MEYCNFGLNTGCKTNFFVVSTMNTSKANSSLSSWIWPSPQPWRRPRLWRVLTKMPKLCTRMHSQFYLWKSINNMVPVEQQKPDQSGQSNHGGGALGPTCLCCGENHFTLQCLFWKADCHNCGKQGHIARVYCSQHKQFSDRCWPHCKQPKDESQGTAVMKTIQESDFSDYGVFKVWEVFRVEETKNTFKKISFKNIMIAESHLDWLMLYVWWIIWIIN